MNFSALSIRHPVPALLLFSLLCLLGIKSFQSLGIQHFPDIELPVITITASMEGAAPPQLETEVARKIESAVASLPGVKHIRANLSEGTALIYVEFEIDKDSEVALSEVRNAIDRIRANLPPDMKDPVVAKITTSGAPIVTFAVESDHLNEEELSWFVDNEINRTIQSVPGVGGVNRIGGVDREISVEIDPARIMALGASPSDISNRLRQIQRDASGGRADIGENVQGVRTLAGVRSVEDVAALDISTANGRSFRLDQVATIKDVPVERSVYAFLDEASLENRQVVAFNVSRVKGASEVTLLHDVRDKVAQMVQQHPHIQITEAFNGVDQVQDNYDGSMQLLYEGALLAVIVVWFFLKDWRATFVSAAALPLSIVPTFGALYLLDYSLNTLTLLSLALVVGILVDDAIVEIENIVRHLRMGKSPYQAAMEAADEIGLAVIATTFTLVAVFLPTAFMGGMPGKFFKPFGWTAAIAVMFSLLVARLLTPMMAAYLLKPLVSEQKDSRWMQDYLGAARWCLNHRVITLILSIAFFVGSLMLIPLLPRAFIPVADRSRTQVSIELAPGSSIEQTRVLAEQARRILRTQPEVVRIFTSIGTSSTGGGHFGGMSSSNAAAASFNVELLYRSERKLKQVEVEDALREKLIALPGARVTVGMSEPGEQLQVVLAGEDGEMLEQVAHNVERDLRTLKGIGNVKSSAALVRPEIHIKPDYGKAASLGVTTQAISDAVRVATSGDFEFNLPKLNLPERQIPIRVRMSREFREDIDALRQLRVMGKKGWVTLGTVADIRFGSGPSQISRLDRKRYISFAVEMAGRNMGEVMAEVAALPSLKNLPPGIERPISGDAERMTELFGSFGSAMLIGVFCIYIVLVLLFHDFLQPVTILAALPLSIGGTMVALLLTNNSFSMPSVIGILMLMGIATKNSILLVEYAIVARSVHGMSRVEALLDACHKRARPIVMTTVAMTAGMIPVALGWSAEPSFRSPMAIAVIGGLMTSTLLSLLVIPVVFTFVDDLYRLIFRKRGVS